MWIAVRKRFQIFGNNLLPDENEINEVARISTQVAGSLNRAYGRDSTASDFHFVVGSRLKSTAVRNLSDIDLYYIPPKSEFDRFDNYTENGQSALLQEIKKHLTVTYSQTKMRGDGQVVVISFNHIQVEVAPAYINSAGLILIPYTSQGGKWIYATPQGELQHLNIIDAANSANVRKIIRGVKAWVNYCNVPLKSFFIEVLVCEFANTALYLKNDEYWFDWVFRDFFFFLMNKQNQFVSIAAANENKPLGNAWFSKAKTAYERSLTACNHEHNDSVALAGLTWQKIFGERIPIYV